MSLIIYETRVDIAIVCATRISRHMSSGRKSEVRISDPAVLDHTHAFLNKVWAFRKVRVLEDARLLRLLVFIHGCGVIDRLVVWYFGGG